MLHLSSVSVVIVSDGNNPRLLNPDFLERNAIVPAQWRPVDTLVTPPYAQVSYDNKFILLMEDTRVHFTVNDPVQLDWSAHLPAIAIQFLKVLPHVSYKATGLNFAFTTDQPHGEEAEIKLLDSMITAGNWRNLNKGITGAVLELQFRKQQPTLNVKLGAREENRPTGKIIEGFVIAANYHYDLGPRDTSERERFISAIGSYERDFRQFIKLLPLQISID